MMSFDVRRGAPGSSDIVDVQARRARRVVHTRLRYFAASMGVVVNFDVRGSVTGSDVLDASAHVPLRIDVSSWDRSFASVLDSMREGFEFGEGAVVIGRVDLLVVDADGLGHRVGIDEAGGGDGEEGDEGGGMHGE